VYADALLTPWLDSASALVPGARIFDAHTHTGQNDPDGFHCTGDELLAAIGALDARAVVFTMNEPDGYPRANDRVLAEAEASGGRLVPFCRLDPRSDPVAEAERCVEAGHRGVKLHPRAQTFDLADPAVEPIFAFAGERRLPVLIHAGRGIPALGRHALELAGRHPGAPVILAHAGVSDLAWIWRHLDGHPSVYFDTAWWNPIDLLTLFSLVPPGRILLGSDVPYGTVVQLWIMVARCGLQAGLTAEQIRCVAGAQLERLLAGQEPVDLGPPPGEASRPSLLLERVAAYLGTAIARMLVGNSGEEYLDLAGLACEVGNDAPEAPVCRSILALLERIERHAAALPNQSGMPHFPGVHLAVIAATLARTPGVPVPEPEPGERADVGEREREA
jgi:hypothetical protein